MNEFGYWAFRKPNSLGSARAHIVILFALPFVLMLLVFAIAIQPAAQSAPMPWYHDRTFVVELAAVCIGIAGLVLSCYYLYKTFLMPHLFGLTMSLYEGKYPPEGNRKRAPDRRRPLRLRSGVAQELIARVEPKPQQGGELRLINVRFLNRRWLFWLTPPSVKAAVVVKAPNWDRSEQPMAIPDGQGGLNLTFEKPYLWAETESICIEVEAESPVVWLGTLAIRTHVGARRLKARRRLQFRRR